MKRWIWIPIVIILAGIAVTWRAFSMNVPHHPDVKATAAMVQRGAYLVRAADCVSCHTVPGHAPFSGGREFDLGSMGTLYSPNITPDKATGIGTWSDDDFRRAMQLGVGKGGVHLYPAFPYASFTHLTDADVLAIKAYLFSLTPVHYIPPADAMRFPYDMRFLMAYWSWLFDSNHRFAPDPGQSAQWNQGKYLVVALGHCGECHTSRNLLQAVDHSKAYAGALTQSWKAYDITPDKQTGIGSWSDADLVSYLSTGFAKDHGPASGPMAEAVSNSLRYLPKSDIEAIVTYLRSLKPLPSAVTVADAASAPEASGAAGASPASEDTNIDYGHQVFVRECANCHRTDGTGTQSEYESLAGSASLTDPQAVNLTQAVLFGSTLDTADGHFFMPRFGKGLKNVDLAAVIDYVSLKLGGHSANLTPKDVAARR
ncbi:MAG: c-type cytochrome [Steroidobacteraceae bacterium]